MASRAGTFAPKWLHARQSFLQPPYEPAGTRDWPFLEPPDAANGILTSIPPVQRRPRPIVITRKDYLRAYTLRRVAGGLCRCCGRCRGCGRHRQRRCSCGRTPAFKWRCGRCQAKHRQQAKKYGNNFATMPKRETAEQRRQRERMATFLRKMGQPEYDCVAARFI